MAGAGGIGLSVRVVKDEIPQAIRDQRVLLSALVRRAAFEIEARAKVLAPVRTGNLRNSIQTDVESDGLTAHVGTGVEYAAYVEFGTRRMAPRPYLAPAAEAVRAQIGRLARR
jgi:HK97 gp10 family phage protein